jgi:hypothetical protein
MWGKTGTISRETNKKSKTLMQNPERGCKKGNSRRPFPYSVYSLWKIGFRSSKVQT